MAKKDMNYIKFLKPQIREKEKQMKGKVSIKQMRMNDIIINTYTVPDTHHNEVCKEAAKMSSQERLMNYAVTKDPTYLGVGCKWDLLTQWGRDKYGKIIGSLSEWRKKTPVFRQGMNCSVTYQPKPFNAQTIHT